MKQLFFVLTVSFTLTALSVLGQATDQIGQLKFTDCKTIKTDTVIDTISGQPVKMIRLTITANTKVQMSCNYGDPSRNKYETIKNKIAVSYAYDSTGIILDSIVNEINNYVTEQEAWANKYNSGSDFSYLPFNKSVFLKDSIATPFIRTIGENPGDYQIFYVNRQVYKIKLLERNGLGCLSLFVSQNMYFTKDDKPLDLGPYIKNTETVNEILRTIK